MLLPMHSSWESSSTPSRWGGSEASTTSLSRDQTARSSAKRSSKRICPTRTHSLNCYAWSASPAPRWG